MQIQAAARLRVLAAKIDNPYFALREQYMKMVGKGSEKSPKGLAMKDKLRLMERDAGNTTTPKIQPLATKRDQLVLDVFHELKRNGPSADTTRTLREIGALEDKILALMPKKVAS